MNITNYTFYHRIGNVIQAIVSLGDNIITILSLGYISVDWVSDWIIYRLDTKLYQQQSPKPVNTDGIDIYVRPTEHNPSKFHESIPIIITKEGELWRAEIADDFEKYSPANENDINFEDLAFHFLIGEFLYDDDDGNPDYRYLFESKDDAFNAATYCNKKYLNNKAKIFVTLDS